MNESCLITQTTINRDVLEIPFFGNVNVLMEAEAFRSLRGEKDQTQKVLLRRQSPVRNLGECLI